QFFWNSGIFVWKATTVLQALRAQRPTLHDSVQRIAAAWGGPDRTDVLKREYEGIERVSIDYAIMEKAPNVLVIQAPYKWDDVGSWLALERMQPQDAAGNTVLARHCGLKTGGTIIVADADHLIATVGVENLLIVQDGQAILVADKREEGSIKQLVD